MFPAPAFGTVTLSSSTLTAGSPTPPDTFICKQTLKYSWNQGEYRILQGGRETRTGGQTTSILEIFNLRLGF